jgi:hypothetical protein
MEGNAMLKPTSTSIEHIEEVATEPKQDGKDVTTQPEEALEFNIQEPIGQESSKGETLDIDTNVEPAVKVK